MQDGIKADIWDRDCVCAESHLRRRMRRASSFVCCLSVSPCVEAAKRASVTGGLTSVGSRMCLVVNAVRALSLELQKGTARNGQRPFTRVGSRVCSERQHQVDDKRAYWWGRSMINVIGLNNREMCWPATFSIALTNMANRDMVRYVFLWFWLVH